MKGIDFTQWEEFGEERFGALGQSIDNFLVFVEPLFRLPLEGKGKQMESDNIMLNYLQDNSVAQGKELLQMHIGVLVRLATELMRLVLISKFMSPTLVAGPVATLPAEGTENSCMVFSAIATGGCSLTGLSAAGM
jgi:hypothetical protein